MAQYNQNYRLTWISQKIIDKIEVWKGASRGAWMLTHGHHLVPCLHRLTKSRPATVGRRLHNP